VGIPPNTQIEHATTMIAITPPLERDIEPVSAPAAPAFESPPLPEDEAASPAAGPALGSVFG